jgi:hypothetical protein
MNQPKPRIRKMGCEPTIADELVAIHIVLERISIELESLHSEVAELRARMEAHAEWSEPDHG